MAQYEIAQKRLNWYWLVQTGVMMRPRDLAHLRPPGLTHLNVLGQAMRVTDESLCEDPLSLTAQAIQFVEWLTDEDKPKPPWVRFYVDPERSDE